MDSLLLAQGMIDVRRGGWLSLITKKPLRAEVSLDGVLADSYSPGDSVGWSDAPARGCVVLVHGMTTAGKADHRLVAFAESLVRLGFTAFVPDLPGMKRFRPEEADVARIERAFSWMTRGGAGSHERCSLLAFSFAAGPALRAAARPAVGGKLAAFIGVGAYYDLKNVLKHLTTSGGQNRPAFPGGLPIRHGNGSSCATTRNSWVWTPTGIVSKPSCRESERTKRRISAICSLECPRVRALSSP